LLVVADIFVAFLCQLFKPVFPTYCEGFDLMTLLILTSLHLLCSFLNNFNFNKSNQHSGFEPWALEGGPWPSLDFKIFSKKGLFS